MSFLKSFELGQFWLQIC